MSTFNGRFTLRFTINIGYQACDVFIYLYLIELSNALLANKYLCNLHWGFHLVVY